MSARREHIRWLAPIAPPCFPDRLLWVEFLTSAAEGQNSQGEQQVLIFEVGKPVRFNYDFNWCDDCRPEYGAEMQRQKRCNPAHLREQIPKEVANAAP